MQNVRSTLHFSPSDLNHFLECEHLTALDRTLAHQRPRERDPHAELLAAKGLEHERAWLGRFAAEGRRIVEIELSTAPGESSSSPGAAEWEQAAARTESAMRAGVDVIYQGVFAHGDWHGIADFLVRVETPSALGAWSYEAWDAKLARHARPYFVLQLCFYSSQLERLQGVAPEWMVVVPGTSEPERLRYRDFDAYYGAVRRRFLDAVSSTVPTYPYPVPHCTFCHYHDDCEERWDADDHLSLVAGIRRDQVLRLNEAGVRTVAQLGAMDATRRIGIGAVALQRLRHQASLQDGHRRSGQHRCDVLPLDERTGFRLLPMKSTGDIFFDMEGDPYYEPARGLEYLFGVLTTSPSTTFKAFMALSREEEKRALEEFIDFVCARLAEFPDLHVYHYAAYETSALKRLVSEHGSREAELDDLLRREIFVDLYQVVRQSIRISHDNYSIKRVREFFMEGAGRGQVADGGDSILQFERWRQSRDAGILEAIVRYNEEDCVSTLELRDWLIERKAEAEARDGVVIPWKPPAEMRESAERETEDQLTQSRREKLLDLARRSVTARANSQPSLFERGCDQPVERRRALALLANLLNYHRREVKPAWWAYFDRRKKSIESLIDDTEAIAELTRATDEAEHAEARSIIYPLDFPPQEHKLSAGLTVDDPFLDAAAGKIVRLDNERGRLWLKRGVKRQDDPLPQAVVAPKPLDTREQRAAIGRVADALIEHADQALPDAAVRYAAVRDLLERRVPRVRGKAAGGPIHTLDLDRQKALVSALDRSYLVIQGPPGSGKTYTGARLIVALLARGKRVGVAANSHKAINNLLAEVEAVALAEQVTFTGLKKNSDEDDGFEGRLIGNTNENTDCEAPDIQMIAGTSWLFSRTGMDQTLDYLFIDEAGQVALADAVAMAASASNVILLGDPQQLPQVRQGVHPLIDVPSAGESVQLQRTTAGCSVLEHVLAGAATISPDRGIFLSRTWRMHPDVCRFISDLAYDGRLESAAGRERQRLDSPGLSGTGLRHLPVEHEGNSQQSYEEARVIAKEVRKLLNGGTFTDHSGGTRPLTADDILVVAPYNMQVRCLREKLPAGVDVGTVDRFQGREAPVVFFSMASSSGQDVPRGLEFLFSRNRFNVAISRARALAVVVCSPHLLDVRCRTVEQLRLVNALCRFVQSCR
ncbi:MAG TPA: TM0106 family RecB-like putative nuclease [Vicinamibacterales bacterium]|nr:TM0106 family RecB-like putative nuclease [Vicinamibacterales bacterium]